MRTNAVSRIVKTASHSRFFKGIRQTHKDLLAFMKDMTPGEKARFLVLLPPKLFGLAAFAALAYLMEDEKK